MAIVTPIFTGSPWQEGWIRQGFRFVRNLRQVMISTHD